MFNKIILIGNLTRDIELRFVGNNLALANTGLATSRKSKGQDGQQKEEVMFVDLKALGRTAEVMNQYLRKGSKIMVEGRLQFEQWVDQNNNKRSKHSVMVETMQMLGSKNDNQQNGGGGYNQQNSGGGYNQQQPQSNYGNNNNNNYSNQQGNSGYGSNSGGSYGNNSYSAPQSNNNSSSQPPVNNEPNKPSQKSESVPEIDIDDDQVPF